MWRFRMPVGLLSDQEQFNSEWMDESNFIQSEMEEINMSQANKRIRDAFQETKVPFWRVADVLGKSDRTFSRMLRHELPEEQQDEIIDIIHVIAIGSQENAETEVSESCDEDIVSSPDKRIPLDLSVYAFDNNGVKSLAIAIGDNEFCFYFPVKLLRKLLSRAEG